MITILRELTSAEKKKSYAKYFYRPMAPAVQETFDILNKGPIDPSKAIKITEINKLFEPGYMEVEKGYCLMPDGTGYIAMCTQMPGVTVEMLQWWFYWHGLESLRYSIWCRDDHNGIHVLPKDLPRRLNRSLPIRERVWDTTDVVDEDVGCGSDEMYISFMSPQKFGYDISNFDGIHGLDAFCANLAILDVNNKPIPTVAFTHFIRPIEGGVELRSRFFPGWHIIDDKPVIVNDNIPFDLVHGLAHHSPKEYANLAAILPELYAEEHNKIDKLENYIYKV